MGLHIWAIGAGYVGLVSGACMARLGHRVHVMDVNVDRIAMLQAGGCPLHEEGLPELLAEQRAAGRLSFHDHLPDSLADVDAVVLGVGTPQHPITGRADLTYLDAAFRDLLPRLGPDTVVITKSTVPVGTAERLAAWMARARPDLEGHTASNPEFLREGTAVADFLRPDRVVGGARTARGREVLQTLYAPMEAQGVRVFLTDTKAAELSKYASNAFLAAKIAFANDVAALAESLGADAGPALEAMGMDSRIGPQFLRPGPGYGGSCFPKDTAAMAAVGQDSGTVQYIVEAAIRGNHKAQERVAGRVADLLGPDVKGKKIAVLGLAFKPGTDDARDAPVLTIAPRWIAAGATVVGCDPAAAQTVAHLVPGLHIAPTAWDAVEGADAVVLMTEWPDYARLAPSALRARMAPHAVAADLRRAWDKNSLLAAGFDRVYRLGDGTI